MPAFITAAYAAVTAFFAGGGLIASAIFNIGASFLVSRLINGKSKSSSATSGGGGGRIQVAPNTTNRICVPYGRTFINGCIVDARISNENKTMTYVLVLGEALVTSATYKVNDIYWNDLKLTFDATNRSKAISGSKEDDTTTPPTTNTDTGFPGNVYIRVYAGNSLAANMLPSPGYNSHHADNPACNAYAIPVVGTGDKAQRPIPGWTSTHKMEGFIFAVVQINYDQDKNFTNLPNITFDLENDITNPADVWKDYMLSTRYGAGVTQAELDDVYLAQWKSYCDQNIVSNSVSAPRYRINGIIDTNQSVKSNIDQILQNAAAWMSYDITKGKWRVYPKKTQDSVFTFNDDNIIGGIDISSTKLDDLYNKLEVEFCNKEIKDQRDYFREDYAGSDQNPDEPENVLHMNLDMINNIAQAARVGRIELKQTRSDLVVQFRTAHVGLKVQAGDVVKVKTELYGWGYTLNNVDRYPGGRMFRISRIKELETDTGALIAEILAQEYVADVYTEEATSGFTKSGNKNVSPPRGTQKTAVNNDGVRIGEVNANAAVPYFVVEVTMPITGGPYDEIQIWYAENPEDVFPADTAYEYLTSHKPPSTEAAFKNSTSTVPQIQYITISQLPANDAGKEYFIKTRLGIRGEYSAFSSADDVGSISKRLSYDPGSGTGGYKTEIINIKEQIAKLDFGKLVIPNSGFWLWKTVAQIDFGRCVNDIGVPVPSAYQMDLGLVNVVEDTMEITDNLEEFVWQVDPK
jgi:hypothetical protein